MKTGCPTFAWPHGTPTATEILGPVGTNTVAYHAPTPCGRDGHAYAGPFELRGWKGVVFCSRCADVKVLTIPGDE